MKKLFADAGKLTSIKRHHLLFVYLLMPSLLAACQPQTSVSTSSESAAMNTPETAPTESFVQHVVAFKFKEGTSSEAIQKHMDDFGGLKAKIPEIRSYEAGKTFKVAYESTADYDVMHYTTFANEADMEVYFNHPDHQKFIEENKNSWADVFVSNSRVE